MATLLHGPSRAELSHAGLQGTETEQCLTASGGRGMSGGLSGAVGGRGRDCGEWGERGRGCGELRVEGYQGWGGEEKEVREAEGKGAT